MTIDELKARVDRLESHLEGLCSGLTTALRAIKRLEDGLPPDRPTVHDPPRPAA